MQRCPIGLIGWGTVGSGVIEILARDGAIFRERCGLDLAVKTIVTRTPARIRATSAPGATVSDRIETILTDPDIAVVVHLVGGTGMAKDLLVACLKAGKRVVTANKALLALHGDELFALAAAHGTGIAFEAAVAGGIPVIAALRDGLVANRIEAIHGILNGTCNFILTKMEEERLDYATALAEAQRLGYAESDPTLDIDGTDTAHKLAILARIAFHCRIPLASIRVEGIQHITFQDIASARVMGARIKLIAGAQRHAHGLALHVAPTLVPIDHPLASVRRNHNGIHLVGDAAGPILLTGQGAGALPTASAVLSDVVDVAIGRHRLTTDNFKYVSTSTCHSFLTESDELTGSYARFTVADRPGVLAGITHHLSGKGISVLSIHQESPTPETPAAIEVITHPAPGGAFLEAIAAIDKSGLTLRATRTLRRL